MEPVLTVPVSPHLVILIVARETLDPESSRKKILHAETPRGRICLFIPIYISIPSLQKWQRVRPASIDLHPRTHLDIPNLVDESSKPSARLGISVSGLELQVC